MMPKNQNIKSNKIFLFDIDNTVCFTSKRKYSLAKPKKKIIKVINLLKKNGHIIKLFTSRYMGRHNDNGKLVHKKYYKKTFNQMKKWNISFDILIMGKPSYDFLIDDKSLNPKNINVNNFLKKYI
jgi:hypothetical protein